MAITLDQEAVAVTVGRTTGEPNTISPAHLMPPIDNDEEPEGMVFKADFPGEPSEQLTIQLKDKVLKLRGRMDPHACENAQIFKTE